MSSAAARKAWETRRKNERAKHAEKKASEIGSLIEGITPIEEPKRDCPLCGRRIEGLTCHQCIEVHEAKTERELEPMIVTMRKVEQAGDEMKLAEVRASLKRWQTRLKRAATAIDKLRKQERYYEKKLKR